MTRDELLPAAEPIQLSLPLAREAPRAAHSRRAIEADFPILEVSRLAFGRRKVLIKQQEAIDGDN